ncbi:tetratricopeptide repeat protein [Streptomyces luteocolor]|uniref:tetratricopeptide repeat protein n=1 Tax=Streptomyces luteocolor TaxID=285500 RepID=UPI000B0E0790|nr:tetratricopeptide repeat protein [Streptomyces luteocolor]
MLPQEAHCFQDRDVGRRLAREMADGGTAVLGQVLSGTGGVGKTQLAARYARDLLRSGEIGLLLWVTAVKREAVVAAYAQAAEDVLGISLADSEQAAARFLAWLEQGRLAADAERGPGWLVVLDDLTDPVDLLEDPARLRVRLWPPAAGPHGRTLVTTRRRDAVLTGHGRRCIDVGLFAREESVAYLTQVLSGERGGGTGGGTDGGGASPVERSGARSLVGTDVGSDARALVENPVRPADCIAELAADLGDLPLAMSQAAAYLLETGLDCAAYRDLLANRARDLARLVPEPGSLPDAQTVTLAATWSLSVDRADRLRPCGLARPLLSLISVLDPSGIPEAVLTGEEARAYLALHRTPPGPAEPPRDAPVEPDDAVDALRVLHRMHLVDYTPGVPHQAVRVHQLVQRSIRESLSREGVEEAAVRAADALVGAWPQVERNTVLSGVMRANTEALRKVAEGALWGAGMHAVLVVFGHSLTWEARYEDSMGHFRFLVEESARRLGADHRDTIEARLVLGDLWGRSGHAQVSLGVLEEVLDDYERICGPDDIATLRARHEVAYARGQNGDVPGALEEYERLLCDLQLREGGDDLPETLTVRGFLARLWGEAGDTVGAVAALEQLVVDREQLYGRDHPETFLARDNLALFRGEAGDADGAVAAFEELVADHERVLGPDQPETFTVRRELAHRLRRAGRVHHALDVLEGLLVTMERVLGRDHIETLITIRDLAFTWEEAGDLAGAVLAYRQQLGDLLALFGPDHAQPSGAASYLANALINRGRQLLEDRGNPPHDPERSPTMPEETSPRRPARFQQALACFHEARDLTDPEESPGVYGVILHDIADTYRDAHDLKEAAEHFRQSVSYKKRADNPSDLATTMTALANTLVTMRETAEAREVLEELAVEVPHIGDVERRAAVLHNMALTYEELGNLGLEGAYAQGAAACQLVLGLVDGEADPGWYATVLKDLGDAYDAQDMLPQAHAAYEEAVRYTRRIEGRSTSLITVLIALGRTSKRLGKAEGETAVNGGAAVVNGAVLDGATPQPPGAAPGTAPGAPVDAPPSDTADAAPGDASPEDGEER